jgi:hypothetical protein
MIPSQRPDQDSDDVIEQLSESDSDDPINPVRGLQLKVCQKSPAYSFYREVRGQLREWWDEFNTRMDDEGRLYPSRHPAEAHASCGYPHHHEYLW